MAKKNFIGIRLNDEMFEFLKDTSLKNGIHHKLGKDIPNINATIEKIIVDSMNKELKNE